MYVVVGRVEGEQDGFVIYEIAPLVKPDSSNATWPAFLKWDPATFTQRVRLTAHAARRLTETPRVPLIHICLHSQKSMMHLTQERLGEKLVEEY
jgi:hypothetical protein